MSLSVNWDNHNKTVLRLFFWSEWTLEEYVQLFHDAITMLESVSHDVDILIDLRTGDYLPKFDTIPVFRRIMDNLPENTGILVYVSESDTQRNLFNIHLKFYETIRRYQARRLFFMEDVPQAYKLIEEHRMERALAQKAQSKT